MTSSLLILATTIFTLAFASDQFWLTTVVTEFKVRDQCAEFWNKSQACPTPLLRISTDINKPTQFASRSWPIDNILNSTKPSFVTQWHGSIDSVRISAQIEGSNPLNPFGLIAKCDEGFHPKVIFNQASENVMERLSTRVIVINSQCFNAKILIKVDTECPYCPQPTTTLSSTTVTAESFIYTHRGTISLCLLLVILTILSISVFIFTLFKFLNRRRNGFKPFPSLESGISTIGPLTNTSIISVEKTTEVKDFFSLMPPIIDYEEFDLDISVDVEAMPRLGSLVYDYFSKENPSNISISDPIFV